MGRALRHLRQLGDKFPLWKSCQGFRTRVLPGARCRKKVKFTSARDTEKVVSLPFFPILTRAMSDLYSDCSSLIQLRQNMHGAVLYVLPELYQATAVRREDMTARTIIAKLEAFLFVQDSVRSTTKFT